MTACFSLKMVRLFPPLKVPIRDGRAKEEMTDDWFFFLYRRPVGGLRSGLPGAATDQLQAVSRAQRQQDQTGYPARAETGMFICCIITRSYIPPPIIIILYYFFFYILLFFVFPSLSSGAIPAGHKVRVHPGQLVWCVHLDREKVSTSRPSCCLKTGSGDLLHAAPAQTRLRHPQPGGHRVPGDAFLLQHFKYCCCRTETVGGKYVKAAKPLLKIKIVKLLYLLCCNNQSYKNIFLATSKKWHTQKQSLAYAKFCRKEENMF